MRTVVVFVLATAACSGKSGSSPPSCNEDPWECPSAQTCWPQTTTTFACLNAGPGALGASCEDTVGTPTCQAGLVCFQTGAAAGSCVASCSTTDPSHACPSGQLCETASLQGGTQFEICVSPTTAGDAGGTD